MSDRLVYVFVASVGSHKHGAQESYFKRVAQLWLEKLASLGIHKSLIQLKFRLRVGDEQLAWALDQIVVHVIQKLGAVVVFYCILQCRDPLFEISPIVRLQINESDTKSKLRKLLIQFDLVV